MKTSVKCPKGGPNEWPIDDYNAWGNLMSEALVIMEKQAETAACSCDIQPQVAFHTAAKKLGLKGGKLHWLVDICLANHHGLLECSYDEHRGKWYMRADAWLRNAPMTDRADVYKHKEARRQVREGCVPEYLTKRN